MIKASNITFGTGTSTYLRNDGTWATPDSGSSYTATSPIDITNGDISHDMSGVTAGTYSITADPMGTGGYYVPSFTVDDMGHLTSASASSGLLPSVSIVNYTSGVLSDAQYTRIPRLSATYRAEFTLTAGLTTGTFRLSDTYGHPSYFMIYDVKARDAVTGEPLDVGWTTDYISSDSGMATSLVLTVTLNEAYVNNIYLFPMMSYMRVGM